MPQLKDLYNEKNTDFIVRSSAKITILKEISKYSQQKESLEKDLLLIDKSLIAFQKLMEIKKAETTDKIEKLVSFGLQNIFEDPSYKFKVIDAIKNKQVTYEFRVFSDSFETKEGRKIIDSRGGGVVNIVTFLLRIILIMLLDRKAERFVAFDEPFNNLSENYHENLVSVVREIAEKLNFQLLIVTHQKSLESFGDVIYELRAGKDGSRAFKISS